MKLLWQQIPSTIISELYCNSDFDGVVIDTEKGTLPVTHFPTNIPDETKETITES